MDSTVQSLGFVCATVDQQICLRWNNFQSNITAQFGTLRDDEDFVDVTIACGGQRFQAHKVVLSACSPFFKEIFKSNPCPHPIIFMRDVEPQHVNALLEFMYAGEVQIEQAHLTEFLRTAESLQIRGLTDASKGQKSDKPVHQPNETNPQFAHSSKNQEEILPQLFTNSTETRTGINYEEITSQNLMNTNYTTKSPSTTPQAINTTPPSFMNDETQNSSKESRNNIHSYTQNNHQSSIDLSPPDAKRICRNRQSFEDVKSTTKYDNMTLETSRSPRSNNNDANKYMIPADLHSELDLATDMIEPKTEPDYPSDEDEHDRTGLDESMLGFDDTTDIGNSCGGDMDFTSGTNAVDASQDSNQALSDSRKLHSLDPRPCHLCGRVYSNLSNLRQHMRLIHHPQTVVCPYCAKQFKTTLYLKRHLVIYHNESSDQRVSPSTSTSAIANVMTAAADGGLDIKPDLQELNNAISSTISNEGHTAHQCYQNELIIKKFDTNVIQTMATVDGGDTYGYYGASNMYPCQKESISFQQL